MGHDVKTQMRHYGQWTDDASTKSAVEASIQSLGGRELTRWLEALPYTSALTSKLTQIIAASRM